MLRSDVNDLIDASAEEIGDRGASYVLDYLLASTVLAVGGIALGNSAKRIVRAVLVAT